MEALSRAEASVLLSLLGADWSETERARIRESGLPRSTYQEAKRRLYQEGYLMNRFVPDPHALGRKGFRFLVVRPFVNEMAHVARTFAEDPSTVTLWVGQAVILVTQCIPEEGGATRPAESGPSEVPGTLVSVEAGSRQDQIAVFFDFEGAWAHVAGASGARRYPRGVPCPPIRGRGSHPEITPRMASALRELLERPFSSLGDHRTGALVAAPFLPRSQRQLLAHGWAVWRVLPTLSRTLAHNGRELRQLLLVVGRLKPGIQLLDLTYVLASKTSAFPFLAAGDGSTVILGALGGVGARTGRGGSVQGTLQAALDDIQILREDLATLEMRLDQRYDRLLRPS